MKRKNTYHLLISGSVVSSLNPYCKHVKESLGKGNPNPGLKLEVLILIPANSHSAANHFCTFWKSWFKEANRTTSSVKSRDEILWAPNWTPAHWPLAVHRNSVHNYLNWKQYQHQQSTVFPFWDAKQFARIISNGPIVLFDDLKRIGCFNLWLMSELRNYSNWQLEALKEAIWNPTKDKWQTELH